MSRFAQRMRLVSRKTAIGLVLAAAVLLCGRWATLRAQIMLGGGGGSGSEQFTVTAVTVNQGDGTVVLNVQFTPATGIDTSVATVQWATQDGTATAPTYYTSASDTLVFDPLGPTSQLTQQITITLGTAVPVGGSAYFTVVLSDPSNSSVTTGGGTVTVTITNTAPATTVQFSAPSYCASESAGSATITATLSAAVVSPASVTYQTADGTGPNGAIAGTDYTAAFGTLDFAVGDSSKTFTVPIIDHGLSSGHKTVNLQLSGPSGATLGSQSNAVLRILDNDPPPPVLAPVTVVATGGNFRPDPALINTWVRKRILATATRPPNQYGRTVGAPTWNWLVTSSQYSRASNAGPWTSGGASADSYFVVLGPIPPGSTADYSEITLHANFATVAYWQVNVSARVDYTDSQGGTYEGTALAQAKEKTKPTFDYQSNGDIVSDTVPATGAMVSPGQKVTLTLELGDTDQIKVTGGLVWRDFFPDSRFSGKYLIKLSLTNAKFKDGRTTKEIGAPPNGTNRFFRGNEYVFVDKGWDGAKPVRVEIAVTDLVEIPATIPVGPGIAATALQDKEKKFIIDWTKATVFPTTLKRVDQNPGGVAGIGVYQNNTKRLLCTQLGGPNAAPAYRGVTVDEVFPGSRSNLKKDWLINVIVTARPTWNDADWQAYFFGDPLANIVTGTFTFDANNKFDDQYRGDLSTFSRNGFSDLSLNAQGKANMVWVELDQKYQCPPGTDLLRTTILFGRTGNSVGIKSRVLAP